MDGPSQPLGCGSTQIGGGVDGVMMGIDGGGQTRGLWGLGSSPMGLPTGPTTPKRKSMDGRMQCSNGKKVQDRLQVTMWQMKIQMFRIDQGTRLSDMAAFLGSRSNDFAIE